MSTPPLNQSPVGEASSSANVQEREAIDRCDQKMLELSSKFPDWYELYDETLPDNAPREEVVELLRTAPNDFAMGLLYGKFTMRLELEAMTGRPFQ